MTNFAVVGTSDQIIELLAGPRQHDAHCQGWRWKQYLADSKIRHANMMEEARQIIARARVEEFQMAAE